MKLGDSLNRTDYFHPRNSIFCPLWNQATTDTIIFFSFLFSRMYKYIFLAVHAACSRVSRTVQQATALDFSHSATVLWWTSITELCIQTKYYWSFWKKQRFLTWNSVFVKLWVDREADMIVDREIERRAKYSMYTGDYPWIRLVLEIMSTT